MEKVLKLTWKGIAARGVEQVKHQRHVRAAGLVLQLVQLLHRWNVILHKVLLREQAADDGGFACGNR